MAKQLVAGFDPGGKGNFGWCVARPNLRGFSVIRAGLSSYADDALRQVSKIVAEEKAILVAAGIDAPLYWPRMGDSRAADEYVRECLVCAGESHPAGKVQAVNSLRGACLVQGFFLAKALEEQFPKCLITEAHPKALHACISAARDVVATAREWATKSEHHRDAIISAWVAAQMIAGRKGVDLHDKDEGEMHRFLKKTAYWWPE